MDESRRKKRLTKRESNKEEKEINGRREDSDLSQIIKQN